MGNDLITTFCGYTAKEVKQMEKRILELERMIETAAFKGFMLGSKDKLDEIKSHDLQTASSIKMLEYRFNQLARKNAWEIAQELMEHKDND